jgi:KaiC/GvpD/RAD55 family RecA-like ATPase
MIPKRRPTITRLPSGVPGLDDVLGGGLPEYSFNLIAGGPGAGVEDVHPALVVDSFRTVANAAIPERELQDFVQFLAPNLTSWQATTFLVGEYENTESRSNPLLTIADGILWLAQSVERSASVRRIHANRRHVDGAARRNCASPYPRFLLLEDHLLA